MLNKLQNTENQFKKNKKWYHNHQWKVTSNLLIRFSYKKYKLEILRYS